MDTISPNAPLSGLVGLREWCEDRGFELEEIDLDQVSVIDHEVGSIWSIFRVESWLQVKGLVFGQAKPTQALGLSLMKLHERLLGCRYAIDDANNLCLVADIFPHDQSGAAVGAVITQMQYLLDSTYGLLCWVQDTDIPADDRAIDHAFEIGGISQLH